MARHFYDHCDKDYREDEQQKDDARSGAGIWLATKF
jgi:hypothetical protein